MFTRLYDSADAMTLPPGEHGYAGYIDGKYPSFAGICERFYPHAHCVSLTVCGGDAAFIDCEAGNLSPSESVEWLRHELAADGVGVSPSHPLWRRGIYFPVGLQEDVELCILQQMPEFERGRYRLWGAHWTGDAPVGVPPGLDALQYEGGTTLPYDVSIVRPDFFMPWLPGGRLSRFCTTDVLTALRHTPLSGRMWTS